jgi:hypothetical protein
MLLKFITVQVLIHLHLQGVVHSSALHSYVQGQLLQINMQITEGNQRTYISNYLDIIYAFCVCSIFQVVQQNPNQTEKMIISNDNLVFENTPDPMTVTIDSAGVCHVSVIFKPTEIHNLIREDVFDVNALTCILASLLHA